MSTAKKFATAGLRRARKRKTPRRDKWMRDFLAALAETSNVSGAAERAKITASHVYKTRRSDPVFARKWQIALCEGYDNLEMELLHRLRSGADDASKARKFDNGIAFRLLCQHRDSVARQKAIQDNEEADAILERINAKIDAMRERAIAAGEYRDDEE